MRFLTALLFFTLVITSSRAQTAYIKTDNSGTLNKIVRLSGGGFVTHGYDANYKNEIMRWDDNFTPLWKVKLTEATATGGNFNNVIEGNDGSIYAAAYTTQNAGSIIIMKISSTGTVLWQKMYSIPGNTLLLVTSLAKGAGTDNGFIFGSGQCALANCLVKCDENGNILWQKQYMFTSSTGGETCWSILPETGGYTVSSSYGSNSLLTYKIDAAGTVTSGKAYTYTGMQIVPSRIVKLNSSNGYAIMGNYNSTNNNKTEFVAFYDNSLTLTSFKELTVTYDQFILDDITAVNNGQNVVVNGNIYHNSVFYQAIINLQVNGGIVWKYRGGGTSSAANKSVHFRGIAPWGNRIVSVGGGINEGQVVSVMDSAGTGICSPITFDVTSPSKTLTVQTGVVSGGAANITAASVSLPTVTTMTNTLTTVCGSLVTAVNEVKTEEISIYPSPADDHFSIRSGSNKSIMMSVISSDGKLMMRQPLNSNSIINTSGWTPGLYSVRISDNKQVYNKKVLVMH
jgi:hypothetical protein